MDAIFGVTMDGLAEIMSKYTELKTQYGERQGEQAFAQYLSTLNLDRYEWARVHNNGEVCLCANCRRSGDLNVWARAYNAWMARLKADPTGRAEAEFHMKLGELSQKAHFGDVRDMSGDTVEGITLDQYAQITVAVSRQGADADAIVRQFGLQDVAHWQRANAAWGAKMGADTTHALSVQYGQLYQKYAGPQFREEMVQQTAAILADANRPKDVIDEPQEEVTPELCLQKMQSPSRNERWKYSQLYANMADLGNVPDKAAAIRNVTPILMEKIERHDEHTTSDAESAVRQLWDLEVRNGDIPNAIGRCLNRAREELTKFQTAFAPIQNQAVPERITLQTRIQDFTSLVETMEEYAQKDWSPTAGAGGFAAPSAGFAAPGGFAAPSGGMPFTPSMPKAGGKFPAWIVAPILLVAIGGGVFAKLRAGHSASAAAAAASASAAAASASVTSASSAAPTASAHAPAATTAAAAHGTPAPTTPAKVTAPPPKKKK